MLISLHIRNHPRKMRGHAMAPLRFYNATLILNDKSRFINKFMFSLTGTHAKQVYAPTYVFIKSYGSRRNKDFIISQWIRLWQEAVEGFQVDTDVDAIAFNLH